MNIRMMLFTTVHKGIIKIFYIFILILISLNASSEIVAKGVCARDSLNGYSCRLSQAPEGKNISQVKHLTVLGIPITGSISNFQQKLLEKKYYIDKKRNRELPLGQREFKGIYSGHQCSLRAYYFPDDYIVYKVRVSIKFYNESLANYAYQEIKGNLQRKYSHADIRVDTTDDHESLHALVIDGEDDILGFIDLILFDGDDTYDKELVVGYSDIEGSEIEERKHTP